LEKASIMEGAPRHGKMVTFQEGKVWWGEELRISKTKREIGTKIQKDYLTKKSRGGTAKPIH